MAYSQTQLTELESAIAEGTTSMRLNGKQIEYRSLPEMEQLRDRMKAELGVMSPSTARSRMINIAGGKGL